MNRTSALPVPGHPHPRFLSVRLAAALLSLTTALLIVAALPARAETCTTQSGLAQPERDRIAAAAQSLAAVIQSNAAAALRTASTADLQKDFGSLQYLVAITSPKLTGGTLTVEQVYLLDASTLKPNSDGSAPEALFYCSLNRSTMETEFDIPNLPPGKYAFAMVSVTPAPGAASPLASRLSFLLKDDGTNWQLAGLYPKPLTAAGHNGLWYWTQARQFVAAKQPWNAWLYYQAAEKLLQPADFVNSTHLDKLRTEAAAAAPSTLSDGISVDEPLVVKAPATNDEFHFTSLALDDSITPGSLDISAHIHLDPPPAGAKPSDADALRKRNLAAAAALLAAYPELRKPFHGVSLVADTPGLAPVATETPISDIP